MNHYMITVVEKVGSLEFKDKFIISAYGEDQMHKKLHQILLTFRGNAEFKEAELCYDYGETYINEWAWQPIRKGHLPILQNYEIWGVEPTPEGVRLDVINRHKAGEILDLEDWDTLFTSVPNHFDTNEQGFETTGEEHDYVRVVSAVSPMRVWTVIEDNNKQYLTQGYHWVNRIKYIITEEDAPDELENASFLWCEFDEFDEFDAHEEEEKPLIARITLRCTRLTIPYHYPALVKPLMFTENDFYAGRLSDNGRTITVRDNHGHERVISTDTLRFMVLNEGYPTPPAFAVFELIKEEENV
jgi:hypothetical protein